MIASSSSSSYYHHDRLGSVVGLSDDTGALTDAFSYDAFGNELSSTGQSTQPYLYLGNRHDPKSGLSDFHARSYQPAGGRFTSKDPVGGFANKPQTMNPYSYGINGPLRYPDPSGRCIRFCFIPDNVEFPEGWEEIVYGSCMPVALIGAGDQCSGGSEEDAEPVDTVEDPMVADGAPEPPEDPEAQYEEPAPDDAGDGSYGDYLTMYLQAHLSEVGDLAAMVLNNWAVV